MGTFVTGSDVDATSIFPEGDKEPAPNLRRPSGWTPDNTIQAAEANAIRDALLDLRTAIRSREFNIRNYGAVGGDSSADYAALVAANAAAVAAGGGTIYIPPGTWFLGSNKFAPALNVGMRGDGVDVSILYYSGSSYAVEIGSAAGAADTSNELTGEYKDFTVQGNGYSAAGTVGIRFLKCKNGRGITNVLVKSVETAYVLEGGDGFCASLVFTNPRTSNVKNGILITGTSALRGANNCQFLGGYLYGDASQPAGGVGVKIEYGDTNVFHGTAVETFDAGWFPSSGSAVGHRFFGVRAEECNTDFYFGSNTTRNLVVGFNGTVSDDGTNNLVILDTGRLYPNTAQGKKQTAAAITAGSGAPDNAHGSDGDYYFRSDGGGGTRLYHKSGGSWSGVL